MQTETSKLLEQFTDYVVTLKNSIEFLSSATVECSAFKTKPANSKTVACQLMAIKNFSDKPGRYYDDTTDQWYDCKVSLENSKLEKTTIVQVIYTVSEDSGEITRTFTISYGVATYKES